MAVLLMHQLLFSEVSQWRIHPAPVIDGVVGQEQIVVSMLKAWLLFGTGR